MTLLSLSRRMAGFKEAERQYLARDHSERDVWSYSNPYRDGTPEHTGFEDGIELLTARKRLGGDND